ncbi:hypothetical protein BJV78DRAFT_299409 [Lactifluus subvellereus]|nr:hypothetical protein BJV78DRAFT_299409 [Lactifluus subvellereus]
MSSNLTFQPQSIPQSPASSSSSSLDDEINNPAARVYFGPIQSPERILIAKAAHRQNNLSSLPVRRSPRLSALQSPPKPPLEGERVVGVISGEQMGAKVAPTSTAAAPDEDCFQDDIELEPPSALATKISRAHDNPSPPPKMQPLEPGCDNPTFPTSTDWHPPSSSSTLKVSNSAIVVGLSPGVHTPSPDPSQAPHECFASLDHGPTASLPANISTDLIVFDDGNCSDVPRAAPFPDLLAPTPIREPALFSGGLEVTHPVPLFPSLLATRLPFLTSKSERPHPA